MFNATISRHRLWLARRLEFCSTLLQVNGLRYGVVVTGGMSGDVARIIDAPPVTNKNVVEIWPVSDCSSAS